MDENENMLDQQEETASEVPADNEPEDTLETMDESGTSDEQTAADVSARVCAKCGAPLADSTVFCPKCGQKVGAAVESGAAEKTDQRRVYAILSAWTGKKILGAAAAVVIVIVIAVFVIRGSRNFSTMYADIADESWCTIASDGSYMRIDTNPWDIDDYSDYTAYLKIEAVNKDLGFSAAVFDDMGSTRALDGKQTAESSKAIATWRYHPDNGLEVTYSWK